MKKKVSLFTTIIHILIIALILSFVFIYYFSKMLGSELIRCAENQTKQITTIVMNNGIRKFGSSNDVDGLLKITKNSKGEITYIHYDTKKINKLSTTLVEMLERDLYNMVNGNFEEINLNLDSITYEYYEMINDGMVFTVPMGAAFGNSLLANIGPKIPLKLKVVGEVNVDIDSNVKEYGFNNAMIEVYVKANTSVVIQMPFLSRKIKVSTKIPLSMEIINGSLPEYYLANTG